MERELRIRVETRNGIEERTFSAKKVLCAGFAGRNQEKVHEHIHELAEMGVPEPPAIPTIYRVGLNMMTDSDRIEVQGENTSGEVEFTALVDKDRVFVTVGSDHTDRDLESYSIEKAKQITLKISPDRYWTLEEVEGHWDSIILRAWINDAGIRTLYQEGSLELLLPLDRLFDIIRERTDEPLEGAVVYSGTIPAIGGIRPSDRFWMQMEDPVLGRSIEHEYSIETIQGSY